MLRYIFASVVLLHGLIHFLGFMKAYNLLNIRALSTNISKAEGVVWLFTTLLFVAALFTYLRANDTWWIWAGIAVVLSQVLIIINWSDAKAGAIANLIILAVVVIAFGNWKFKRSVEKDIQKIMLDNRAGQREIVTVDMLKQLPEPVEKWVVNSGVVGKEKIHSVHLTQKGWMRTSPDNNKWIPTKAEQYFAIDKPGFVWKVQMDMLPLVQLVGEDRYADGRGRMNITALSLIDIVNESGSKIDQGTLQRYLAEICWFPSAALSPHIKWEAINDTSAKATMRYNGVTGAITFHFNNEGEMVACTADRFMGGGKNATLEKWVVTSTEYAVKNGIKMPVKSEVTWKLKRGDYTWYKLEITGIEYNQYNKADWLN